MLPVAQGTFSMITGWPRASCKPSAITRPIVSVGPPAGDGTTRVTVREGQVCASAWPPTQIARTIDVAALIADRDIAISFNNRSSPLLLQLHRSRHKRNSLSGWINIGLY